MTNAQGYLVVQVHGLIECRSEAILPCPKRIATLIYDLDELLSLKEERPCMVFLTIARVAPATSEERKA